MKKRLHRVKLRKYMDGITGHDNSDKSNPTMMHGNFNHKDSLNLQGCLPVMGKTDRI